MYSVLQLQRMVDVYTTANIHLKFHTQVCTIQESDNNTLMKSKGGEGLLLTVHLCFTKEGAGTYKTTTCTVYNCVSEFDHSFQQFGLQY